MEQTLIRYDPWNTSDNIFSIFDKSKNIYIYGPLNKNGDRFYIKFFINIIYPIIEIQTVENGNRYLNIELNIKIKKAKIIGVEKYISKYSGTDLMKLGLKLVKNLNIHEVFLDDFSIIECKNRNNIRNLIFTKKISYSIISLFKNGKTFYMKFGFIPYLDGINISDELNDIIMTLRTISWSSIDNIIKKALQTLNFIKNSRNNIITPQLARMEDIILWEKYWTTINKSYQSFFEKYKIEYESPFKALENFDDNQCKLFIDWLELYSLNKFFFRQTSFRMYKENGSIENIIIPYKDRLINFFDNFKRIIWKIDNLLISSELKNSNNKYVYIDINHA